MKNFLSFSIAWLGLHKKSSAWWVHEHEIPAYLECDDRSPYSFQCYQYHLIPKKYYTNPRLVNEYGSNDLDPDSLELEALFDGHTDWDENYYTNGDWNPLANPNHRGGVKSAAEGAEFIFDVPPGSYIEAIKFYLRSDCCEKYYTSIRAYVFDSVTGDKVWCQASDPNDPASTYIRAQIGHRFTCDPTQTPNGVSSISIWPGNPNWCTNPEVCEGVEYFFTGTEVEAYGLAGEYTPFFEPSNLMLRNYAPDLLRAAAARSNTITNPDDVVDKLLTHGCWCAKLDKHNPYLEFLGGPDPVDELDELCKLWFKCRNCNDRLEYGSCNIRGSSSMEKLKFPGAPYHVEVSQNAGDFVDSAKCVRQTNRMSPEANPHTDVTGPINWIFTESGGRDYCAEDSCQIDLMYVKKLYEYLEDNHENLIPYHVVDNSTCSASINTTLPRLCTGEAPYKTPMINNEYGWNKRDSLWKAMTAETKQDAIDNGRCSFYNETSFPEIPFRGPRSSDWNYRGTGVVYKAFLGETTSSFSWHDARTKCAALGEGVQLARAFCPDEQALIHQTIMEAGGHTVWMAGNDITEEGKWYWLGWDGYNQPDGIQNFQYINIAEEGGFENWGREFGVQQPDNRFGDEDCLAYLSGYWLDFNCNEKKHGYICEKRFYK